jgi:membrane-associated phospholipid phosphatase
MSDGKVRQVKEEMVASSWQSTAQAGGDATVLPETGTGMARAWQALKKEVAEAWAACGAFEWWALGYLGVSSLLILVFAENLAHPLRLLCAQAVAATIVLTLCWVQARSAARERIHGPSFAAGWWHYWRHWYPHLFFLFCFEELAYLMTLVTPRWQDAKLIAFDRWLTGVHPSVWLEQFATPFRNDAMQLVYFTYFTYLLIVGFILYVRREWQAYWSVMTYSMVGYSIGYLMAMFLPVESPWFAMAGWWKGPLEGGPFTAMMAFIEHYGRVRGAAFPSAHVIGATTALWGAWKYRRWLFWTMLPIFLMMCVSTIWGRYHYVADVLAGVATGSLGYAIGSWVMKRKGAVATAPESELR